MSFVDLSHTTLIPKAPPVPSVHTLPSYFKYLTFWMLGRDIFRQLVLNDRICHLTWHSQLFNTKVIIMFQDIFKETKNN